MPYEDNLSKYFKKETGLDFEIISTVDHPYINPPIRLIDSHNTLLKMATNNTKICVLNWDVSQPNNRTYRYDNQLDLAFIGKNNDLFFFNDKIPYAIQNSNRIDLDKNYNLCNLILDKLLSDRKLSKKSFTYILNNLDTLKNIIFSCMLDIHEGYLVDHYTKIYLQNFYNLINHDTLSNFIEKNYLYYHGSAIENKWIPFCILNVPKQKSLATLMHNGIMSRRLFRVTSTDIDETKINSYDFIKNSQNDLISLIREGHVIPSIDIFYWSMELANKKHFGNDYGFFQRYGYFLNHNLENQLTNTSDMIDGKNILEIKEDYSLIGKDKDSIKYRTTDTKSKTSRINSMTAIYLLTGSHINNINLEKIQTKTIQILDGNIMIR